jgi:hypothetical protein
MTRHSKTESNQQNPVAWIEVERGIPMFVKFDKDFKPEFDGLIPLYIEKTCSSLGS